MGHERKLKSCCNLQVATKWCKLHGETPTAHARSRAAAGRAAGSFVGAIVEGYACSYCAIRVVAAPQRTCVNGGMLDGAVTTTMPHF